MKIEMLGDGIVCEGRLIGRLSADTAYGEGAEFVDFIEKAIMPDKIEPQPNLDLVNAHILSQAKKVAKAGLITLKELETILDNPSCQ